MKFLRLCIVHTVHSLLSMIAPETGYVRDHRRNCNRALHRHFHCPRLGRLSVLIQRIEDGPSGLPRHEVELDSGLGYGAR